MRPRRLITLALPLCLASAVTPASGYAQAARHNPDAASQAAPLLSSPVWSQPVTVLDYLLLQLRADLEGRARLWQDSERSGLWTSTSPLGRPDVTAVTGFRRGDGKIVVGFEIRADRFTKPHRDVCARLFELSLAQSVGVGETYREVPVTRRNWFSHLMPRSAYALLSEEQLTAALDHLQAQMVLHVGLYEGTTKRSVTCERPALGDSMTVRELKSER